MHSAQPQRPMHCHNHTELLGDRSAWNYSCDLHRLHGILRKSVWYVYKIQCIQFIGIIYFHHFNFVKMSIKIICIYIKKESLSKKRAHIQSCNNCCDIVWAPKNIRYVVYFMINLSMISSLWMNSNFKMLHV